MESGRTDSSTDQSYVAHTNRSGAYSIGIRLSAPFSRNLTLVSARCNDKEVTSYAGRTLVLQAVLCEVDADGVVIGRSQCRVGGVRG